MRVGTLALIAAGTLAFRPALAAINWNITGAGARAEGMAGAFTGVADDATSVAWNPAGLATLVRPEGSFVARAVGNSVDYDWSDDVNALGLEDSEESDTHGLLNFLSGAYPFEAGGRHLVAGLALQSQLDGFSDSKEESGYVDSFGDPLLNTSKSDGSVSTLTPAIGVQLNPMVALGLAVNVWTGSIDGDDRTYTGNGGSLYDDYSSKLEASGTNFGLGVLLDLSSAPTPLPLKLGLNLRTPFELEMAYSDNWGSDFKYKVEMPLMLAVGASVRLGEFTTLAVDLESRQYGGSKIKVMGEESPLTDHGKDLFELRVGAEHLFVTDFAVVPLRVGFRSVPSLESDYDYDSTTGEESYDPANGFAVALGTGLIFEQMAFDLALSSASYETEGAYDGETLLTVKNTTTKVTLSGIIYF